MKRELKFRSWDGKTMTYPNESEDYANVVFSAMRKIAVSLREKERLHIMQFTGLQDKNGKDIYEGDILAGYATENGIPVQPEKGHEIIFENGAFTYKGDPLCWDFDEPETLRVAYPPSNWAIVIGNVHQNPELLKTY